MPVLNLPNCPYTRTAFVPLSLAKYRMRLFNESLTYSPLSLSTIKPSVKVPMFSALGSPEWPWPSLLTRLVVKLPNCPYTRSAVERPSLAKCRMRWLSLSATYSPPLPSSANAVGLLRLSALGALVLPVPSLFLTFVVKLPNCPYTRSGRVLSLGKCSTRLLLRSATKMPPLLSMTIPSGKNIVVAVTCPSWLASFPAKSGCPYTTAAFGPDPCAGVGRTSSIKARAQQPTSKRKSCRRLVFNIRTSRGTYHSYPLYNTFARYRSKPTASTWWEFTYPRKEGVACKASAGKTWH